MKSNTILIFLFILSSTSLLKGQQLNLNDLKILHKKETKEISVYLQTKSINWKYQGYEGDYNWWQYDNSIDATFIKKVDGDLDSREIIIVTNNKEVMKTILDNIKSNDFNQIDQKTMYVGKDYAVAILWEKNNNGETIFSIHFMTRNAFYK